MYSVKFKSGEIVLCAETPEKLNINEPYSLFVCEDEPCNAVSRFAYAKEICVQGQLVAKSDSFDVYEDELCRYFYYHPLGVAEYYACRKVQKNDETRHIIYIPEEYKGKIWTRLIFSLISFDDLAAHFGAAVFHASVVEYNGKAILFTGPCSVGKSTQAFLWQEHKNAKIINGDKALIYKKNGEYFVAGLPFSGSSGICKNKILPVCAVVRLGQAKENTARLMGGIEAYKAVYEGCYHSVWSRENNVRISSIAADFAKDVPVYNLECLPDTTAVDVLFNKIFA